MNTDNENKSWDNERKLKYFTQLVVLKAEEAIKNIDKEIEEFKKQYLNTECSKLDEEIRQYYDKKKSEIDSEYKIKLSRLKIDKNHEHLNIRNNLREKVFKALTDKVTEFTKTPQYDDVLQNICGRCLDALVKNSSAHKNITIMVYTSLKDSVKHDLLKRYIADYISKLAADRTIKYDISAENSIKLGGLRFFVPESGIIINETFDERLTSEKDNFGQLSF
jgi:vacuolar-type H+-ATPase subunit E/Vma4